MYSVKYVFAQLIKFMNRNKFNRIVTKYDGDRYVKYFTFWNQLLVMMFGQLCNPSSLRDLITILDAHCNKCFHTGMDKNVSKTNLAHANQNRNCKIFEEFAYFMTSEAMEKRKTKIFDIVGNVNAFDSTTIDLCLAVFWWAKFRKKKGGIKVHTLYDVETPIPAFLHITTASVPDMNAMDAIPYEQGSYYIFDRGYNDFKRLFKIHTVEAFFVVRAKKNLQYKTLKGKRRMPKNVLSDSTIELTGFYSNQNYSGTLRMVRYWDDELSREFTFLTNITHFSSLQIAELYRNRWKVELFFKWLKQHLKIKKFWGYL